MYVLLTSYTRHKILLQANVKKQLIDNENNLLSRAETELKGLEHENRQTNINKQTSGFEPFNLIEILHE